LRKVFEAISEFGFFHSFKTQRMGGLLMKSDFDLENFGLNRLVQRSRKRSDGGGYGIRLLGDEGVARAGDHDDGDAIA
jgi:hypothetical protein